MTLTFEETEVTRKQVLGLIVEELVRNPSAINCRSIGNVLIRPVVSADYADVISFYEEAGGLQDGSDDSSSAETIIDYHKNKRTTLCIARSAGTGLLFGIGSVDWSALTLRTGLLGNLLVAPSARRCGVGESLIRYRESLLSRFKCIEVHAMIKKQNHTTQLLYKKCGYSPIFDGDSWQRPPFLLSPDDSCNMLSDCVVVAKSLA